jgi:succinyl-diaminopimelate desuccinylase
MKLNAVQLSQELIKIKSYSGNNPEVINFLADHLKKLGFVCDILNFSSNDSYQVNNLHAVFNPKNYQKILYFAGHTDIVKEGDLSLWKFDPFSATIFDEKIFGRGASDMKCSIACFVSAVSEFLEKENPQFSSKFGIGFLITNDEENDAINGTKKVLEWMKKNQKPITHCLVGEPTNPEKFGEMIKIGRRGSVSFKVKIIGKQGHVAYPENAINPITSLIGILKILKDHKFDEGSQFFDPTNLEITSVQSENLGGNVIPNIASAEFNIRFNDLQNSKSIIELVEYVCSKAVGIGAKSEISYRVTGESFLSKPDFLAKITIDAVEKICGQKPILSTTGGTSDARFIKDYAEVVEIGLVNKTAHQIDEFAEISEIEKLQKTYLEILENFSI